MLDQSHQRLYLPPLWRVRVHHGCRSRYHAHAQCGAAFTFSPMPPDAACCSSRSRWSKRRVIVAVPDARSKVLLAAASRRAGGAIGNVITALSRYVVDFIPSWDRAYFPAFQRRGFRDHRGRLVAAGCAARPKRPSKADHANTTRNPRASAPASTVHRHRRAAIDLFGAPSMYGTSGDNKYWWTVAHIGAVFVEELNEFRWPTVVFSAHGVSRVIR